MTTTTINQEQLISILNNVKMATFVQVVYKGVQKTKKRNNPFGEIKKQTKINATFCGSYENAVNNRLKKAGFEADFEAKPLPWGQWLKPNRTISHNENTYVRLYMHKNSNPKSQFWHNNKPLEGDELVNAKMFFNEHSESKRQAEAGLQFEDQSKPFNVNIANILEIKINNEHYIVE